MQPDLPIDVQTSYHVGKAFYIGQSGLVIINHTPGCSNVGAQFGDVDRVKFVLHNLTEIDRVDHRIL